MHNIPLGNVSKYIYLKYGITSVTIKYIDKGAELVIIFKGAILTL